MKAARVMGICIVGIAFRAAVPAAAQIDPPVPGEVMVRLAPGSDADAFAARFGIECVVMQRVTTRDTYVLAIPASVNPDQFALDLAAQPEARWSELNYVHDAPEASGRNFFLNEVASPIPFANQAAWSQVGVAGAQAVSRGAGVVVAVIDTGVDPTHTALAGRIAPGGIHFRGAALPPDADTMDAPGGEMSGHGTHVAGIIAHVAPEAMILPIRALDPDGFTDSFRVAAAMYYALDSGAAVINMSLGSTYKPEAVEEATAEAIARGVIVVAAAGNMNRQQPEEYPAFIEEGVLSVGAVDVNDVRAPFSNYGPELMISAPGSRIYGPIPGEMYAQWDGTSFATPMVAGVAALLIARDAGLAPADATRVARVGAAIRASAVNINDLNPQYAGLLGGRLDAARALTTRVVFEGDATYPGDGPLPEAGLLADLNGDFALDAVIANTGGSTISIRLNVGGGQFRPAVSYPTGAGPQGLASADFDDDGDADLAVANGNAASITILRNNGNGQFQAAATVSVPSGPSALAAADFDGDGFIDLAVNSENLNRVTVLWNNAGQGFVGGPALVVGAQPVGVAAADFNADNAPDIAAVNRDANSVTVWRYAGNRQFGGATTHAVGLEPRAMQAADFDADGRPDIVTMNRDSDSLSVLWNSGAGFTTPLALPLNGNGGVEGLTAVDADCDGLPDLAALYADAQDGLLLVLLNQGGRMFGVPAGFVAPPSGDALLRGDVDGDGDDDLAIVQATGGLALMLNQACIPAADGDLNCDGLVNFFDIDPFVVALITPDVYPTLYPGCNLLNADMNGDARVNFFDIDPFVARLIP